MPQKNLKFWNILYFRKLNVTSDWFYNWGYGIMSHVVTTAKSYETFFSSSLTEKFGLVQCDQKID